MKMSIKERTLSNENIFLAISLVHSYIQEVGLLSKEDRALLEKLKDVYDENFIKQIMKRVKARVSEILSHENLFFSVQVYFKPKKRENDNNIFRPIHTASLIDQIAMMAMAQVLIYDVEPVKGDAQYSKSKLIPSELSRLIPSNFYGNRVSYDAVRLFKPWQEQYKEYTSKASDYLYRYSQSHKYKYEVDLDLKEFFPSIEPKVIFGWIKSKLPLNWLCEGEAGNEDINTVYTILRKLLIFKLSDEDNNADNAINADELSWYLNINKEKAKPILENNGKTIYAKGLPQGLPHTYYFANIMMIAIKQVYQEKFPGEMLFYVDDSVIFTDSMNGFNSQIESLNSIIELLENDCRKQCEDKFNCPNDYTYNSEDFGMKVHSSDDGKSTFSKIDGVQKGSGELYLSGLCRETSTLGADIFLAKDDEESKALKSRSEAILKGIVKEINRLNEIPSNKRNDNYLEKLIRYKKFFHYRLTVLDYKCRGDIDELIEELSGYISLRADDSKSTSDDFFQAYSDDILASLIPYVLDKCQREGHDCEDLRQKLSELDKQLFCNSARYSYISRSTKKYFEEMPSPIDRYHSLELKVAQKYSALTKQNRKLRIDKLREIVEKTAVDLNYILKALGYSDLQKFSIFISGSSSELERKALNAVVSYILGYAISDDFVFTKTNGEAIQYSELRILSALRNPNYDLFNLRNDFSEFFKDEFCVTADYSILQVMDTFKSFVISQKYIDQLIRIHKYCCDTWKNGSKHLYFYTLHNQEHAVTLIMNVRKIINSISCIEVKTIDYFILFAACYLHDISMVSFPDYDALRIADNEDTNYIVTKFIENFDAKDTSKTKGALFDAYQDIDSLCERVIRGHHASDSAEEIRRFSELGFIEPAMREIIARVSAGHGYSTDEVYHRKSQGKQSLVSEKMDMIILRLADLLDMSRYRISRVIFDHNLRNINATSRFHWISHLLTDGYTMELEYKFNEPVESDSSSYIKSKLIEEKVILTVNVLMSQTTPIKRSKECVNISNSSISQNDNGNTTVILNSNKGETCKSSQCNFLCRWFTCKNEFLIEEVAALQSYLNSLDNNYFKSCFELKVEAITNSNISNEVFDYLREYIEN